MSVSIENAEHYIWGEIKDGWHLLKHEDMSVIQERVPAGGAEVMHYHNAARQFFIFLKARGQWSLKIMKWFYLKGRDLKSLRK